MKINELIMTKKRIKDDQANGEAHSDDYIFQLINLLCFRLSNTDLSPDNPKDDVHENLDVIYDILINYKAVCESN